MPHFKVLSCPSAAAAAAAAAATAKASLHFHQQEIGASWFLSKIPLSDYTFPSWGIC